MNEEFYIGWQDKAPKSYSQWVKYVVWTLVILVPLIAGLLVLNQRGFIGSKYEITRFRTLEGILITEPIPCLKIPLGKDLQGLPHFQRILLIGMGKKSASPALEALAQKTGKSLMGKGVRLQGKLIYYDGVVAFELGPEKELFQGFSKLEDTRVQSLTALGKVTLRGEILDPKCYLGVMRPGEGKPHRSCAIRCLAGGIPAFFKANTVKGKQYCFVLDQNGKAIGAQISPYVADEVQLCGLLERWDNWYVLKVDEMQRLMPYWGKGMVMCQ